MPRIWRVSYRLQAINGKSWTESVNARIAYGPFFC